MQSLKPDLNQIRQTLSLFLAPDAVVELRIFPKPRFTISGYFDDVDAAVKAAASQSGKAPAVYITVNPAIKDLLARAVNRLQHGANKTTSDDLIANRRWLFIDIDPKRPGNISGISSSDIEHDLALERGQTVAAWLKEQGWPEPIIADSGNGGHVYFSIDLPNDEDSKALVERSLKALAARFNDKAAELDTSVFNAARITKVYGTAVCKGDHTAERPHRLSKILSVPDKLISVPIELLKALASEAPAEPEAKKKNSTKSQKNSNDFFANVNDEALSKLSSWVLTLLPKARVYKNGYRISSEDLKRDLEEELQLMPEGIYDFGERVAISAIDTVIKWGSSNTPKDAAFWLCQQISSTPESLGWKAAATEKKNASTNKQKNNVQPATKPKAIIKKMGDIKSQRIRWLWANRIAQGKPYFIAGDPGLGKSMLSCGLASTVSNGGRWPDGSLCPKGDVIIISAEDDPGDTIRPRLDAAGADVNRVYILEAISDIDGDGLPIDRTLSLKRDVDALDEALGDLPECRLVIIDPISAYMGGVDSHNNTDVRAVLAPITEIASRRNVTIISITHLNKGGGSAIYRTMGSLAFVAAARGAFGVVRDQEQQDRRLFLPIKNNIGDDRTGHAYRIRTNAADVPYIEWEDEPISEDVNDALLSTPVDADAKSSREAARDFLKAELKDGVVAVKELIKRAKGIGLNWDTVSKARYDLKVIASRRKFDGGWDWELPEHGFEVDTQPERPPWGENDTQVIDSAQDGPKMDTFQERPPSSILGQPCGFQADSPPKVDTVQGVPEVKII